MALRQIIFETEPWPQKDGAAYALPWRLTRIVARFENGHVVEAGPGKGECDWHAQARPEWIALAVASVTTADKLIFSKPLVDRLRNIGKACGRDPKYFLNRLLQSAMPSRKPVQFTAIDLLLDFSRGKIQWASFSEKAEIKFILNGSNAVPAKMRRFIDDFRSHFKAAEKTRQPRPSSPVSPIKARQPKVSRNTSSFNNPSEQQAEEYSRQYVPGSRRIRFGSMISKSVLITSFPWSEEGQSAPRKDNLFEHLLDAFRKKTRLGSRERFLVLAEPGMGKTTLVRYLFNTLMNCRKGVKPMIVDLRTYELTANFGKAEWCLNECQTRFPKTNAENPNTGNYVWLLDSLDEFLSVLTHDTQALVLCREIFRRADIVVCRRDFYDRFLRASSFPHGFKIIYLHRWEHRTTDTYVRRYLASAERIPHNQRILFRLRSLFKSEKLALVCANPLRLTMLLEICLGMLERGDNVEAGVLEGFNTSVTLYSAFMKETLFAEELKRGNSLSLEVKRGMLEYIAWEFYGGVPTHGNEPPFFTRGELARLIETKQEGLSAERLACVVSELISRSVLEMERRYGVATQDNLRFTHKTFHEYFAATYLFHSMLEKQSSLLRDFRIPLNPGISEFLKELLKTVTLERHKNLVSDSLQEVFSKNLTTVNRKAESRIASRIARQQAAYYLGALGTPTGAQFLIAMLDVEKDLWVERGMQIGLAFGGRQEFLENYLAQLTDERKFIGPHHRNAINIGFHLSFFGDQPFDAEQPDIDQGLQFCDNTVRGLIYQTCTETDRASWKLNLYTLLDLERNRRCSALNFKESLISHYSTAKMLCRRLLRDRYARDWPETIKFNALVRKCGIKNRQYDTKRKNKIR